MSCLQRIITVTFSVLDKTGNVGIHPRHQQINPFLLVSRGNFQQVGTMGGMLDGLLLRKRAPMTCHRMGIGDYLNLLWIESMVTLWPE